MCAGIALAWSELPTEMIGLDELRHRIHDRGGEREFRFYYRDRRPRLPVWRDGRLTIARWGNGRGQSRFLPRTGWTWHETIEGGGWQDLPATIVDIPASLAYDRGVWYRVRQGLRGLLVPDERGFAVAYIICQTPTSYYQIMTRSDRMPLMIEEWI